VIFFNEQEAIEFVRKLNDREESAKPVNSD